MPVSLTPVPGAGGFVALATLLARSKGDYLTAYELARASRQEHLASVLKAAVESGGLDTALAPYRQIVEGFTQSLASLSVLDRLLADGAMRRCPLRANVVSTTGILTGATVDEAAVKPLSSLSLTGDQLEPVKSSTIVVVSNDLVRMGGAPAQTFLFQELRLSVARATDARFLSDISSAAGASVTSTGTTAAQILADLNALLDAVVLTGAERPYWILRPVQAATLTTLAGSGGNLLFPGMSAAGGTLLGLPALVSNQLPANTALLLDASAVVGDSDTIVLDAAVAGALAMRDDPSAPSNQTSLYQTDSTALRAERWWGAVLARSSGAAKLVSIAW